MRREDEEKEEEEEEWLTGGDVGREAKHGRME